MIETIPLNTLKFFYYVANCGSVTLASQKLFVTQSAVSKQIKTLETLLAVQLFERINKTLVLTKKGQLLFECCQSIFPKLDTCLQNITTHTETINQPLVLSCEPTFAMKWLIPRLPRFNALNHGFDILLLTGGGAVDFSQQKIDIAIRRNDFDFHADWHAEKIADEYIMAVKKQDASDTQNTLFITSSRPNFLQQINKLTVLPKDIEHYHKQKLEHFYLCLEACMAGMGITVMSAYTVQNEIANQLLTPLSKPIADGSAYYLLSQFAIKEDDRKVKLMQWLKNEMVLSQANHG